LANADRDQSQFIAIMTHELRHRIAIMQMFIDLLQKHGALPAEVEQDRCIIAGQINHLSRLLNDLVDVGRLAFDKLKLRFERVESGDVIHGAVDAMQPMFARNEQRLKLKLARKEHYLKADAKAQPLLASADDS